MMYCFSAKRYKVTSLPEKNLDDKGWNFKADYKGTTLCIFVFVSLSTRFDVRSPAVIWPKYCRYGVKHYIYVLSNYMMHE